MKRTMIAVVAGTIVYYIWGMMAWMALPIHTPTIAGLPDEAAVTDALKAQNLESGVYVIPWSDNEDEWSDPNSQWMKNHLAGPLYTIYYQNEGGQPMASATLIGGFIIDLCAVALAVSLLSCTSGCCQSFAGRVGFITGLGVFVALIGHVSYWNWMNFPTDYTVAFIIDVVVGWALAGLVIAAIVKPKETQSNATNDTQ